MSRSDPDAEPLLELVIRALDVLEEDGHVALEALLAEHPDQAPTVRRRLAVLAGTGLAPREEETPERFEDFDLEQRIGHGGMGVVWRARQRSLDRPVALKLVRPDQLLFDGARERFQREVETVARLQHPGIVPVLAYGEERGLPFYAMELVQGATLAEVVERLQGRDPRTLTGADLLDALPADDSGVVPPVLFEGPWPDVCVRVAREVAEALEHARRHGVVHRDVKPSNVMVTRAGRVLLLDFGLASVGTDQRLTRSGSTVGSLAYMAPERMPGSPERARPQNADAPSTDDCRQDVYSLGVTLYELLTLEPPYRRAEQLGLVRAALDGDVVPLRERNRSVSSEVAMLVAVAMERDPARRYADAGALARDLANALERRPLEARPPGPLLRVRRWAQRRPLAATLLAAAVAVPSVLLAQELRNGARVQGKNDEIATRAARLGELNEDLEASLAEASAQEALAGAALQKAMEAVDRMMVRAGDETFAGVPGLEGVRREVLGDALEFQEWFLENAGDAPGLELRTAQVAFSAAQVLGWTNRLDESLAMLDRAEELLLEHGPPEQATGERRALWIELLSGRHRAETLSARFQESDRTAARILGLVGAGTSVDLAAAAARCSVQVDRARRLRASGDLDASEALLLAAIEELPAFGDALQEEWAGPAEDQPVFHVVNEAARLHENLSALIDIRLQDAASTRGTGLERGFDRELLARGRAAAEESARLGELLLELDPDSVLARARAARTSGVLGLMLHHGSQFEPALARFERAVELLQGLVADHPGVIAYREHLVEQITNVGGALHALGDVEGAIQRMEESAATYDEYFARGGSDLGAYMAQAGTLYNVGVLRETDGELEGALEAYDRALDSIAESLRQAPDHTAGKWHARLFLEQVLPTFAVAGEHERMLAHLRTYAARTRSSAELLDLVGALGGWIEAVEARDAADPEALERIIAGAEAGAAALLGDALEAGTLERAQVEGHPDAGELLFLPGVHDVLERHD